jgi:alpha-D-xyloside xylohydrolase
VQFYLPEGRWTSFWTGEVVVGPGWRKEVHGFLTLPLYVRVGTVLVLGQEKGVGGFGYDWLSGGGEVRLYGVKPGDRAALVDKEGKGVGEMVVGTDGNVSLEYLRGEWSVVEVS